MTRYRQKKWVKAAALVLAALAGTWAAGAALDIYEVATMTNKMKTVCVGRMLIDLPEEAQLHWSRASIDGFDIETFAESSDAFHARVMARKAEIRSRPDWRGGNRNLETEQEIHTDSGLQGTILVHGRYVKETTAGYSVDTLRRIRYEGTALEAHVHGDGISIEVATKNYDLDRVDNLPRLVSRLVPNPRNTIPTEPGFCFDRAWARDPLTADQGERIVLTAGLPRHPDIAIRFDTMAGIASTSKGLLERNAASHARAPAIVNMRFTTLRAAPRTIGGLAGEELVEQVVEENFALVGGFEWEANGSADDVFAPAITLRMATGKGVHGPVSPSLSNVAALALWDALSSSVRIRPTSPPRQEP